MWDPLQAQLAVASVRLSNTCRHPEVLSYGNHKITHGQRTHYNPGNGLPGNLKVKRLR